jgi:MFS superfamily sulfate permease-like transporter
MKKYTNDFLSSVVVFLVALPLCMGISIASGVPPALGLITGIIGGLVVGTLSGAPLQVSGPAAGLAVLVWEMIQKYGLEALGPILMVSGALQLVAGQFGLGRWFRAMSPAVVHGMLAGIGVLIFASQFHVMLDDKPKSSGIMNLLTIPQAIYSGIFPIDGSRHELAAVVGLLTILTLVFWTKFRPAALKLVPAALVAVVAATGVAMAFGFSVQRVEIPSNLLDAVRLPSTASFSIFVEHPTVWVTAIAMAFIASAETLLSAAAVDRMQTLHRTNYDKELRAQGVGNLLCGVVGSLPMTGVIVRSSANVQAGAQTRMSTILHGLWLLIFTAALAFVIRAIPTSALGAILVYTGYKLVNINEIRHLGKYGKFPVFIYAATMVGIVVTDLLTGVLIGVGLSVAKLVYEVTHLQITTVQNDGKYDIYLKGAATFFSIPKLAGTLESLPAGSKVCVHIVNLAYIDHSCLDMLAHWKEQHQKSGADVEVEWEGLIERYARLGNSGALKNGGANQLEAEAEMVTSVPAHQRG